MFLSFDKSFQSNLITESDINDCIHALNKWDFDDTLDMAKYLLVADKKPLTINLDNEKNKELPAQFSSLLLDKNDKPFSSPALLRIVLLVMCNFKRTYLCNSEDDDGFFPVYIPKFQSFTYQINVHQEITYAYGLLLAAMDIELDSVKLDRIRIYYRMQITHRKSLLTVYETMLIHEKYLTLEQFFRRLEECYYLEEHLCKIHSMLKGFNEFITKYQHFLKSFLHEKLNIKKICATENKALNSVETSTNVLLNGLCVIVNISTIAGDPNPRRGSEKDVHLLENMFKEMDFSVKICKIDCTEEQFATELSDIKSNKDFSKYDCLVMFIMSHGKLNFIQTADGVEISIRDVVRYFNDKHDTIWKGKKRFFFIQACRSVNHECNITELWKQTYDVTGEDLSDNMLVAFSCNKEEEAKRKPEVGSIYIQTLCLMIYLYGHRFPVQVILDVTAKYLDAAENILQKTRQGYMKLPKAERLSQSPEYLSRLNADYYFSPHSLIKKVQRSKQFDHLFLRRALYYFHTLVGENLFRRIDTYSDHTSTNAKNSNNIVRTLSSDDIYRKKRRSFLQKSMLNISNF